jgi:hypothetical protein
MRILRYCGNTYDPRDPLFVRSMLISFEETTDEAVKRHSDWLSDKVIGDPQPTQEYSVAQLQAMNMVGVYMLEMDQYGRDNPEHCQRNYEGWLMKRNGNTWESI